MLEHLGVQKLTKEIIHEAIQAYKDARPKGYWLKLYYFATDIDITVFDQLQAQEIKRADKLELQVGLDDLKAKINKPQLSKECQCTRNVT